MTEPDNLFDDAYEEHGRFFCRCCIERGRVEAACERYFIGFYAGMYCDQCWSKDSRNHDRPFDPMDAGERMEPDDY